MTPRSDPGYTLAQLRELIALAAGEFDRWLAAHDRDVILTAKSAADAAASRREPSEAVGCNCAPGIDGVIVHNSWAHPAPSATDEREWEYGAHYPVTFDDDSQWRTSRHERKEDAVSTIEYVLWRATQLGFPPRGEVVRRLVTRGPWEVVPDGESDDTATA